MRYVGRTHEILRHGPSGRLPSLSAAGPWIEHPYGSKEGRVARWNEDRRLLLEDWRELHHCSPLSSDVPLCSPVAQHVLSAPGSIPEQCSRQDAQLMRRSAFYLGQTFSNLGHPEHAAHWYGVRAAIGGSGLETAEAFLRRAEACKETKSVAMEAMVELGMQAVNQAPERAEPCLFMAKLLLASQPEVARMWAEEAVSMPCVLRVCRTDALPRFPEHARAFVRWDVYAYKARATLAAVHCRLKEYRQGLEISTALTEERPEDDLLRQLHLQLIYKVVEELDGPAEAVEGE